MKPYVWLDNKIISFKDIDIPFCDEGFLYGQGLFETMRSYDGQVFLLDRHIRRLINSCKIMDIAAPDKNLLKKAVLNTAKKNKLDCAYIRLNVWKKNKKTGIFVFTKDMDFYSRKDYAHGFSAVIFKDIRQNEYSPLVKVKSLNHYFYILLTKMAKAKNADEAIILNDKGGVCEGSRSNIFIIKKGIISTPAINSGCLPGITREIIMEIAKQLSWDLRETEIKPEDLFASDEAFLTNSLIEVMPLTKINAKIIGDGTIGRKTQLILDCYRKLIRECYK
ncbi:MAG: aminotransferase class IV [Candidatus Omnitrophica bacterium]|nr:aminotransferase class IV [Candidatus Omnitrophota bacterium]MDD5351666.1 aminotransferase class IV [Candidatus Omnitrophota bacterium]MDD5550876.1 aminotransferase class IV [Candidatus Omnitrophota bacterium]